MFSSHPPKISICIPLYGTEAYLLRCLESVGKQNFTGLEVIVVDDCSPEGAQKELSGKNIVKKFSRSVKFPVTYIRHEQNKGLVEARRTAIYEAKGEYIFILDSDDQLPPDSLQTLYQKALQTDADIVQGKASVFFSESSLSQINDDSKVLEALKNQMERKVNKVFPGELNGADILDGYLVNLNHNGILWGKLYKKELYLEALNHIPPIFCTMAEDVIQYFWLSALAKKYVGIDEVVYNYSINTGISSHTKIESLERWEKVCSTASVFTAIYTELQRLKEEENVTVITEKQAAYFNHLCRYYLKNNLLQLQAAVIPELQVQARQMLCEYWGAAFVEKMEAESKPEKSD